MDDPVKKLRDISGGTGYNDVFVFAPVRAVVEQGDAILGFDGCLNFFAGPNDPKFSAMFNFYNVHYAYTHIVGTSGGTNDDMKEALEIMSKGLDPAGLVTHIGGLNCVPEATNNLPDLPGGKKLIYTHIDMPLTAIADFGKLGDENPLQGVGGYLRSTQRPVERGGGGIPAGEYRRVIVIVSQCMND